jgi:hypothetical protein
MPNNNFKRRFELINELQVEPLFKECLLDDIENGEVFPAVRNGYIDFYYKGGRLFNYNKEIFKTHRKYLSIIKSNKDYLSENDIKNVKIVNNFSEQYKEIKENCANYSGIEAQGVYYLCKNNSFINSDKNVVVLDIEICFDVYKEEAELDTKEKKLDRIDILLYSTKERLLKFVEAKHFSNPELWSKENTPPRIKTQIDRYNRQINNKKEEIKNAYSNYVKIMNELFELDLKEPRDIKDDCGLYIFGYDKDQLEGRFKKLLKEDGSLEGIKYYTRGDQKKIDANTLWNKIVK